MHCSTSVDPPSLTEACTCLLPKIALHLHTAQDCPACRAREEFGVGVTIGNVRKQLQHMHAAGFPTLRHGNFPQVKAWSTGPQIACASESLDFRYPSSPNGQFSMTITGTALSHPQLLGASVCQNQDQKTSGIIRAFRVYNIGVEGSGFREPTRLIRFSGSR